MHENFTELDENRQKQLLLKNISVFDNEFDSYRTKNVTKIYFLGNYIVARFETVFNYQFKTAIFDNLAKPVGIIIYSIYNDKSCLDFIFVKREFRNQGLGDFLIKLLKYEIIQINKKYIPIFVTPVALDVPISENFMQNADSIQYRLEKFYVRHNLNIVEIAEETVFGE